MMRSAVFSTAHNFGGLLRRFGAVLFGIGAIREEAQRGLMHPRRDAISVEGVALPMVPYAAAFGVSVAPAA